MNNAKSQNTTPTSRRVRGRGLLLTLGMLLASCGGGGGDSDSSPSTNPTNTPVGTTSTYLYLTDDFSTEYDAVWVTVQKIVAFNGTTETVLADYTTAPLDVNLPMLKRAGLFTDRVALPNDTTEIRIYVGSQARIVGLDGAVQSYPLQTTAGGYLQVSLSGYSTQTGVLALDFDLPSFQLVNGVLQPAMRVATSTDLNEWTSRYGEIEGTVQSISASSMTILGRSGLTYTVALGDYTTYRATTANWTPAVGSRVEVNVLISGTSTAPTFQAMSVSAESLFDSSGSSGYPEVEGRITAISNDLITIAVEEAEDIRFAGTAQISVTNATFTRGAASLLAVGQKIEAHVNATIGANDIWQAQVVEIEGARKTSSLSGNIQSGSVGSYTSGDGYAEIKGQVTSLSNGQVSLQIYKAERAGTYGVNTTQSFNLSNVVFTEGSVSCLGVGSALELKGYLDGSGAFVPNFAELDGACYGTNSGTTNTSGAVMEAKGRVTSVSVGTNSFIIQVLKVDDWFGAIPQTLTVNYVPGTTYFEDIAAGQVSTNMLIEAKGTVENGVMTARKIELD